MSDYTKTTNFTAKDSLSSGDPNKLITGALFDTEFDAIETASATKTSKEEDETITGQWLFSGALTGSLGLTKADSTGIDITFKNSTATTGFEVGIDASEVARIWNYESTNFIIGSANTEIIRIVPTNEVGIGNTTPASYDASGRDVVVGNHTGNHGMTIASGNTSQGTLYFADGTTGTETYVGFIGYNHNNNRLLFGAGGVTRGSLYSDGGMTWGSPTGASQGAGTINADTAYYVDGNKVRDHNDEYAFSGTTGSLAAGTQTTVTLTHGLGTDDVIVELSALGNGAGSLAYDWAITATSFDGYNQYMRGGYGNGAVLTTFTPASTGQVGLRIRNDGASSQTISYRGRVIKRTV